MHFRVAKKHIKALAQSASFLHQMADIALANPIPFVTVDDDEDPDLNPQPYRHIHLLLHVIHTILDSPHS